MDYYSENPNYTQFSRNMDPSSSEFLLSDYLVLDECPDQYSFSQSTESSEKSASDHHASGFIEARSRNNTNKMKCKNGVKKNNEEVCQRVEFRTKSELEIMDDGFKWRKYGKKAVKNSPNPRNYYKCSSGGCTVKKRVERDPKDSSYVLTTYEGVHNHESPCVAHYNQMPLMLPSNNNAWTLQASAHSSNFSSSYTP
ncbi:putative WRKY transcription factor [Quillaja saponaria]|uniref:WRKY transcription factor n=1 Tax=Quillaja saponaria TaxID=32244 RepID=A0AAD7PIK3_QUISA|nr:putative WRKY transcription factor [Quillaja saponaria]